MLSNPRLGSIALFVVLAGCAEPEVDPEEVGVWANAGSALGVYTHLHTPVAFAIGEHSFVDPTCPITTDDGTTLTVTGGCTDSEQQRFEGTFTITRVDPIDAPRDLDLSFSEYGSGEGDIALLSGTAMVRTLDDALYSYDVELVHAGLATVEIDYAGTVAGDYGAATLWNGSGTVTRSGFSPTGTAEVSTVDQLVDDAICSGQSASGETTIEVDQHVMVVTYDGETDCDEDQAARWSLDGEPQGLVEGITCAVVSDAGPAGAMFWLLALLGLRRRP